MAVRNSPVVLLPTATGNLPFSLSQQPYILVNPLDLALRQTFQPAAAATLSLPTASATSNTAASTPALTPTVIGSAQLGGMPNSVVHAPAGHGCIVLTASPASSTSEGTATTCTSTGRLAESTIEHHRTGMCVQCVCLFVKPSHMCMYTHQSTQVSRVYPCVYPYVTYVW